LLSWTAEALLNDADGYWGGDHNFFIYDEGAKGFVFFPHDLDSSLDYLGRFDSDPITWWSVREDWTLPIPQHYLIVIGDPTLRRQYIEALRAQLGRYDVAALQAAIDTAANQIRAAVAADPHRASDVTPPTSRTRSSSPAGASPIAPRTSPGGSPARTAAPAPTPTATASSGATTAATIAPTSIPARRRSAATGSTTTVMG
jgi:hypothetical protein